MHDWFSKGGGDCWVLTHKLRKRKHDVHVFYKVFPHHEIKEESTVQELGKQIEKQIDFLFVFVSGLGTNCLFFVSGLGRKRRVKT